MSSTCNWLGTSPCSWVQGGGCNSHDFGAVLMQAPAEGAKHPSRCETVWPAKHRVQQSERLTQEAGMASVQRNNAPDNFSEHGKGQLGDLSGK